MSWSILINSADHRSWFLTYYSTLAQSQMSICCDLYGCIWCASLEMTSTDAKYSYREMTIRRLHEETSKEMALYNSAGKMHYWRVPEPGCVDGNIRWQDEGRTNYWVFGTCYVMTTKLRRGASWNRSQKCDIMHYTALCISRTARRRHSMKNSENSCSDTAKKIRPGIHPYCSRTEPSSRRPEEVKNRWQVKEKYGEYRHQPKWLLAYSELCVW